MKEQPMSDEKTMGQVIQIDEARIRDHLGEMVRGTVEETLNAMLDAEADRLCGAGRYERSEARQGTRAGSYERTLHTKAGEVSLRIPKLRRQTFETAIIERYRRRESSVEEALIEMYLAGVSVRRVEDITEALWGTRVSPSTVSNLNKKIYAKIEAVRRQNISDIRFGNLRESIWLIWFEGSGCDCLLMQAASLFDGPSLDGFPPFEYVRSSAEVDVGRC
jgi:putative transposase